MHFGFALELSDIDFWNTDLLDTHLGLLNPKISIQISPVSILFSLHKIFKRSSRHVIKTSSRYAFKTSSRHVFKTSSRHVFKTSSRRLQRNNFSSSKTSSRYYWRGWIIWWLIHLITLSSLRKSFIYLMIDCSSYFFLTTKM